MSEVKVNKISPRSSTTVTLGDASDVFQLPASAEIDIASGATLDVNGTIDLTGATTTGFPAGGLTQLSQWRLTADFTATAAPIASNLAEVATPDGFGKLPDVAAGVAGSMTESSGIFTFPSTGLWRIDFISFLTPHTIQTSTGSIYTTHNDSTWVQAAFSSNIAYYGLQSASCTYLFRVAATSTHKVRFHIGISASAESCTTHGNADVNETSMTFLKLADI
tara:strand:- start:6624 stop:7286 length:663 start_codon:yes stop_codon:yes gene_type:complete